MQDTEAKKKEIKRRFQLWIRPSTLELADTLYKKDNCDSKSEFIEKAVIFYAGYLRRGQQNLSPQYRHIHTEKHCGGERSPAEPDDLQAGCGAGGDDECGRGE